MIFTETTSPKDLVYGFIQFKIPYRYAFAFMIGLRYIPLIEQDSKTIEIAQTLRGQGINRKSSVRNIFRHIFHRISTLLISIIRKAKTTANTIDARGFGADKFRTNLHQVRWNRKEWTALIALVCWISAFILIQSQIVVLPFQFPALFDVLLNLL
jgi:energy-coupling factor transport system permease protein